ncbi:MAG: hypothetical protein ACE5EX_12370, partial [Phycisphaerae bacterium]
GGGRGAPAPDGGGRPTGVAAAARKLEGFGVRSWRELKATLRRLLPPSRPVRARGRKQSPPRPASCTTLEPRGDGAPSASPARESRPSDIRPRRQGERERWDRVTDEPARWGDLDAAAEAELERLLREEK